MGRSNRRPTHDGEIRADRKLKLENQKLKKQISALRKQLSRVDIDRYQNLKDIIEAQDREDDDFDRVSELADLKDKWQCHTCAHDHLRLIIVPRIDGTFYFRRCPTCRHKTKLKKYTEDVEGIRDEDI